MVIALVIVVVIVVAMLSVKKKKNTFFFFWTYFVYRYMSSPTLFKGGTSEQEQSVMKEKQSEHQKWFLEIKIWLLENILHP